jgi:hypothetical protein
MNVEESLQRYGMLPAERDLPAIRALLAREAEIERSGGRREDDLALLCCVQLFSRGLLEDVLRIWDAKQASMDLAMALDVQFLCGAGLDATKRFLASQHSDSAREALEYIVRCDSTGDFEKFSPQAHLQHYRNYFGVE